jgi:hypothetical protein
MPGTVETRLETSKLKGREVLRSDKEGRRFVRGVGTGKKTEKKGKVLKSNFFKRIRGFLKGSKKKKKDDYETVSDDASVKKTDDPVNHSNGLMAMLPHLLHVIKTLAYSVKNSLRQAARKKKDESQLRASGISPA